MGKSPRLIFASGMLLLAVLACNLPGSQSSSQPDLAATITAQAMLLETPTSTSESQTQTPAATGPEVSVSAATNCRTGPGSDYDVVFTMNPGSTAQVVGKDTADNYWIINNPSGGTCWLWGQYATLSGDTSGVPDYPTPAMSITTTPKPTKTPMPTKTPTLSSVSLTATRFAELPAPPTNLSGSRTCASGSNGSGPIWKETYILTWTNNTNVKDYTIYLDGALVAYLVANSTRYSSTFQYEQGLTGQSGDVFVVSAENDYGYDGASVVISRCTQH